MTSEEFVTRAIRCTESVPTLYVQGGWGQPLTDANKAYFINCYDFNKQPERTAKINAATAGTFAFDCVCFVKSLANGFIGDASHKYGGAQKNNPLPDVTIEKLYTDYCYDQSEDMSSLLPGELVCNAKFGHCGIWAGEGKAIESINGSKDGVQIRERKNYWTKHAKLKCIDYFGSLSEWLNSYKGLKKGDKNEGVKRMQELLISKGFDCGPEGADGSFGGNTKLAVAAYQEALAKAGFNVTVNGIADFDTLNFLRR